MTANEATFATVVGSGAFSALVSGFVTWRINRKMEKLKSDLDRGMYVTKAHYDLELESFKGLWAALNDLRLKVRAFRGPEKFQIHTPDGEQEWFHEALANVTADFFDAHNTALKVAWGTAPFYPEDIKKVAERAFDLDLKIIQRLGRIDESSYRPSGLEQLKNYSIEMDHVVAEAERMIRARLESLRVMP